MSVKKIVTAVLLLFLAVAVATLVVKEVRHSRALEAAEAARAGTPGAPDAGPAAAPAPDKPAEKPAGDAGSPPSAVGPSEMPKPAPAPAVKAPSSPTSAPIRDPPPAKASAPATAAAANPTTPPPAQAKSKVVVYYLHTTARCSNCLKIEAYTAAEVTGPLGGLISDGRLEWKVLNVDQPENAHYVEDYQLFTKSVVVSEVKNGKEVRWKRLDKVWDYLGDQQAFMRYVGDEVKAYVEGAS